MAGNGTKFFRIITLLVVGSLFLFSFWRMRMPLQWSPSVRLRLVSSDIHLMNQSMMGHDGRAEVSSDDQSKFVNKYRVISQLEHGTGNDVELYIDLEKFKEKLRQKYKVCKKIHDPLTLWKSQDLNETKQTSEADFVWLTLATMCGGFLDPQFLSTPPREELYPFEAAYLSVPPVWRGSEVSSHLHSTISMVGSRSHFTVGDKVAFVIKIADGNGTSKTRGGDRLKVWVKDLSKQHSISAKIVDFDNGTYLATTVLPWSGTVRVMAVLRNSREYIRTLIYIQRALKATYTFAGAYINSKAGEAVPCSPFPIVPGFNHTELCNLTLANGNSPWFCGRPQKSELRCSDFKQIRYIKEPIAAPITPVEANLLLRPVNQRNFLQGKIIFSVHPDELGATLLEEPEVACNKVATKLTWHQATPEGYFYNKTWRSILCHIPEKIDPSCFQNAHMIFYGDSNSRSMYVSVQNRVKCKEVVKGDKRIWHIPRTCQNKTTGFTLQYMSHPSPFHALQTNFTDFLLLQQSPQLFDSIPSRGRYIISLSPYLHYTSHHISAFERALVALRDALIGLLNRNPDVIVVIRAPHVAELGQLTFARGDNLAEQFIAIEKEVFKSLQDRVIYLPTWDMTVASEDYKPHPDCNDQIAHVLLQFMCGRQTKVTTMK